MALQESEMIFNEFWSTTEAALAVDLITAEIPSREAALAADQEWV